MEYFPRKDVLEVAAVGARFMLQGNSLLHRQGIKIKSGFIVLVDHDKIDGKDGHDAVHDMLLRFHFSARAKCDKPKHQLLSSGDEEPNRKDCGPCLQDALRE